MEKTTKHIKQIIIFIEGLDLTSTDINLSNFTNLNKALSEGSSTILVDAKKSNEKISPLVSLLWFDQSFQNETNFQGKVEEDSLKTFKPNKNLINSNGSNNDDNENIEVKFLRNPSKFSEISDIKVCIWTNNEQIATFSEFAEISYYYSTKETYQFDKFFSNYQDEANGLELAIINLNLANFSDENINIGLKFIDEFLFQNIGESYLKLIFSPFGVKFDVDDVIQKNKLQIKDYDSKIKNAIESIIPNQTWQYTKGEKNDLFTNYKDLRFCLNITHSKINRTDKIDHFSLFKDKENWSKMGGGIIWIAGLLREIMFELGKFPKFGA